MARDLKRTEQEKKAHIESEFSTFLSVLEKKYDVGRDELLRMVVEGGKVAAEPEISTDRIPLSVISERRLSGLEAISKFMRENLGMRYNEIAAAMNRNAGTVGITYRKAKSKMSKRLEVVVGPSIPVSIFRDRKFSVLESIVRHLRSEGMTLHDIAVALRRDDRTIWTVEHRAKKKLGMKRPGGRKR